MNYFLLFSIAVIIGLLLMSGEHSFVDGPQTCDLHLPTIGFGTKVGQWNYNNLEDWDNLDHSSCGGSSQSPIDINPEQITNFLDTPVDIIYVHETSLDVRRLPHTMEVTGQFSTVTVPDKSSRLGLYRSIQFHLHVPSEHTVMNKSYPMEIHFVHIADKTGCDKLDNKLSVLGVFVDVSAKADSKFFDSWEFANDGQMINGFNLYNSILKTIPKDAKFYNYLGSLTTPPCTETVNWFVLQKPIYITPDQLDIIQAYFRNPARFHSFSNNRPTNPLNDRVLSLLPYKLSEINDHTKHAHASHGAADSDPSLNFLGEFTCCFI